MEFQTQTNADICGTSLRGYVTATRADIESVFGRPSYATEDAYDKVTTEWDIEFGDGTLATIYDWKRYEMGAPAMDEITQWHIGGTNYLAVEHITDALGISGQNA